MLYVEDWERVRARHLAWWSGEIVDRMAIGVTAPRAGAEPFRVPPDVDLVRFWTDTDYVIECAERQFASTYFAGDQFPSHLPFLGPIVQAAFLGCDLVLDNTRTGWLKPLALGADALPPLRYDPDNRWWRLMQDLTRTAVAAGRGRFLVGLTDLCSPGDDLAALVGAEAALAMFADRPDRVDRILAAMCNLWKRYLDELHAILVAGGQQGSCGTFTLYSPGRSCTLQSDMSCMISPAMFDRHIAPILDRQARHLDHAIYHVDGPGAIRHVPSVAAVASIDALNWIPGAGQGPMRRWAGLIREMQDRGKPVQCSATPEDVEPILEVASPRGLFLHVRCESEAEADQLVGRLDRWTAKYDKPFGSGR